ncbi:hypothetical protein [Kordia sp.]|uniref:hypothetical protein n=1 Tax=Kordia sp. TaxID=1965332 RepID=UPI003B5C9297
MKLFPTTTRYFRLIDDKLETIDRLKRRTDKSHNLTSDYTDKTFRGIIKDNQFKLISSVIGKGAFCVMKGEINTNEGHVSVEIHKVFRILLSIILCFPPIGITIVILLGQEEFHPVFIPVVIIQVIMIRYIFIGLAFKSLSRYSLNRLRDVLDVDWIQKK